MNAPRWESDWIMLFGSPPPGDLRPVDPVRIRVAYRKRARETHPDRAGPNMQDGAAFREVTAAYHRLLQHLESTHPRGRRPTVPDGPVRVVSAQSTAEPVPPRRLALAQFLVYLGWVSWDAALEALRWQQDKRCPLGTLGVGDGLWGDRDVRRILARQRPGERFGACAIRLGLLSATSLTRLVDRQRRLLPPIGQYFVQAGLITRTELRCALERQGVHNARVRDERPPRAA